MHRIAVIIPSGDNTREDSLSGLLADLRQQTRPPQEIEIVHGVSPSGRARNLGIERTKADFLVFIDDDVRLGNEFVLESLLKVLLEDSQVGLVGTAQLLPEDSSPFQRKCAQQIPRSQSALVSRVTESDIVTTACCMARRCDLARLGNFHDRILRGVDPELRNRYRQGGFKIVVAPNVWHHHPMPSSFGALLRIAYRNGYSSAFAQRHFPETVFYNPEGHVGQFEARPSLTKRVVARAWRMVGALLSGRLEGLSYDLAYALGYLRFRLFTATTQQHR